MTHDQFQEQISRLLDNDLREEESTTLFTHMASCLECQEFLRSCLRLRSGLAADSLPVPASTDKKLREQFSPAAAPKAVGARSLWSRHVAVRFPALVLLVCLVAAGAVLALSGRSPFYEPETIYVTRMPAVVITNGAAAVQPKN